MPKQVHSRCGELIGRHIHILAVVCDASVEGSDDPFDQAADEERHRTEDFFVHGNLFTVI